MMVMGRLMFLLLWDLLILRWFMFIFLGVVFVVFKVIILLILDLFFFRGLVC